MDALPCLEVGRLSLRVRNDALSLRVRMIWVLGDQLGLFAHECVAGGVCA